MFTSEHHDLRICSLLNIMTSDMFTSEHCKLCVHMSIDVRSMQFLSLNMFICEYLSVTVTVIVTVTVTVKVTENLLEN
jgi:hypothetical protein